MPSHLVRPMLALALPAAIGLLSAAPAAAGAAAGPAFQITMAPELRHEPVTARVYVMLGPANGPGEPRFGPNWFQPRPFFAVDAKGWKPGEPLAVGADAIGFPDRLDRDTLAPGEYRAQAVVRLNPDTHRIGDGAGNAFGPAATFTVGPDAAAPAAVALKVDRLVPPRVFRETERVKLVDVPSPLLSAFHGRPIRHRAAVVLPEGDPRARRGTLYVIPGFGGDHFGALGMATGRRSSFGRDLIRVLLDPDCGTGHHVFADSATNGPRGRALVEELIPHIETTFPAIADPRARLLNGHSSGGWSSLWLQVAYPDVFGGTWSTSPDPVDFRDFQRIDLYARDANVFRDAKGERRPLARRGTKPVIWYDTFSKMEDVIGDGGQLHSFEAVFSPRGPDGRPRPLWDRATGAVDPITARAWEPYDIRLVLERNWKDLGPKLRGKLHVVTGGLDTFYLEGAVKLLKESLQALGGDAVVEVVPGRDHGTVLDAELSARFDREMNEAVARVRAPVPASAPSR